MTSYTHAADYTQASERIDPEDVGKLALRVAPGRFSVDARQGAAATNQVNRR
jgi:hypothetical protein